MTTITSVELNFLVFRYLQESGFVHSAFSFGYEAGINKCTIDGNQVPPGALITFVQKGLQYMEMEANLSNNDGDVDDDFSFLQPLDLITKNVHELREIVKERRKNLQKDNDKDKKKESVKDNEKDKEKERERDREKEKEKEKEVEKEHEKERARVRERDRHEREKEAGKDRERMSEREKEAVKDRERTSEREKEAVKDRERISEREKEREREKQHEDIINREGVADQEDNVKHEKNGTSEGPEAMDIFKPSASQTCEIPISDVMILEGHTSEVCACAWSPTGSVLASGSGDSTARIWTIPDGASRSSVQNGTVDVLVLKHVKGRTNEKSKDVTTLDWNGEGTLLATGSYDGQARLWSTNGELKTTLSKHKGPIFSLKWNKKGDFLLTGSCDKTAIVWDLRDEEWRQQFEFHTGPILDVDWRNNVSFATSSTDNMIYVCKVGENRPIKTFTGHQGEVNCVKWDPTGSLLASCSDDISAKIWSMKQDKYVHDLKEHSKEIYTLRWSPTGPGTNNLNQQLVLASASFDSTVKLWDVEVGKLLGSLNGHREPVYSVAFSPNGEFLASGSLDRSIIVWSLKEGKIVKTFTGNGGIFEVCWNKEGDRIAACSANNSVCVLDLKM